MVVEQFVSDEYVSACFHVVCDLASQHNGRYYENSDNLNLYHENVKGTCGDSSSQFISGSKDHYVMYEENKDQGRLICFEYPSITEEMIKNNAQISWKTQNSNKTMTWNHVGHIIADNKNRPNHS